MVSVCVWFAQADLTDCVNCVAARYPNVKFEGDRPVTSTDTLFNDIKKSLFDEKKKAQETFLQPLMNSINNLGAIVKYQSFSSPLAFLKVTKSQLKQIESLPKVVRIYLDDDTIQAKDLCSTGVITTRTYELWDRGFNGGLGPIARTDQNQVVEILASGGLYVRKGPSTSYPAIASVSQGQEFAVLRWENYWAESNMI